MSDENDRDVSIRAWLMNQALDDLADYLQRGRRFETATEKFLEGRFVELQRELFAFNDANKQERHDIQAEIEYRGEEIPWDLVTDEMKTFREELLKRIIDVERCHSERPTDIDQVLSAELLSFRAKLQDPSN